ncbi:MAG: cupin domain-containing protein [Gammaproteobacteria bacterium]|nr:cupin domain-containing protein [Gammaproteobacteria bacterium]
MSTKHYAYAPANYPTPHSVVGIDVTVLVSKDATNAHEITLQTGEVGSGPPPHSHPWDESFFVVKGAVRFVVEGETTEAKSGAFFHLPAGTVHGFCVQEPGTTMLEITGADSRSTAMFETISDEIAAGLPKPEDAPALIEILGRYGAKVHM